MNHNIKAIPKSTDFGMAFGIQDLNRMPCLSFFFEAHEYFVVLIQ